MLRGEPIKRKAPIDGHQNLGAHAMNIRSGWRIRTCKSLPLVGETGRSDSEVRKGVITHTWHAEATNKCAGKESTRAPAFLSVPVYLHTSPWQAMCSRLRDEENKLNPNRLSSNRQLDFHLYFGRFLLFYCTQLNRGAWLRIHLQVV